MKNLVAVLFLTLGAFSYAQSIDYNTKKGFAANGYDVVSYFDGKAMEGLKEYTAEFDGVNYKFANANNRDKFKKKPTSFIPQYGGYCAYAVAKSGKKVNVNPETFEIRDGKLYLFYNSGKTNTLKLWLKEAPNDLKSKADKNWDIIKN